jgi:hypothetical protein
MHERGREEKAVRNLRGAVVKLVLGSFVPDLGKVIEALKGLIVGKTHAPAQAFIGRALRIRFPVCA